mmetsp:Transcript_30226/g.89674  ORF Transcript_30226/g.89674 Transcript_30226/m.89674 type:complete len:222 (+) Transcript_30226:401-1066(+)
MFAVAACSQPCARHVVAAATTADVHLAVPSWVHLEVAAIAVLRAKKSKRLRGHGTAHVVAVIHQACALDSLQRDHQLRARRPDVVEPVLCQHRPGPHGHEECVARNQLFLPVVAVAASDVHAFHDARLAILTRPHLHAARGPDAQRCARRNRRLHQLCRQLAWRHLCRARIHHLSARHVTVEPGGGRAGAAPPRTTSDRQCGDPAVRFHTQLLRQLLVQVE